jgi:hypothetical protein
LLVVDWYRKIMKIDIISIAKREEYI